MYQIVVTSYEDREKEILEENSYLRQLVQDIFHTVLEKRNYLETEMLQGEEEVARGLEEFVEPGIFQLPVEMMKDTVIEAFDQMFCEVGDMFGQCASNDHDEVEMLKIENSNSYLI